MASDTSTAMCTYNKEREKKCRRQHEERERKSPYNTRASSSFSSFLRYVKKKKLKREGIKNKKERYCENILRVIGKS